MNDKELAEELRKMKVNTKGLICLGCEHEDGCSLHGCNIIGAAADRLELVGMVLDGLEATRSQMPKTVVSECLNVCLNLFGRE